MNSGKSKDDLESLPLKESTSVATASPGVSEEMDLRRRRLIRGAAGLAPVVLTLRSGSALALNSSCTGAKLKTSTDSDSKFTVSPGIIQTGDKCVIITNQTGCPAGETKIRNGFSGGYTANLVDVPNNIWQCSGGSPPGLFSGAQNVAILSSSAAASLNI